MKIALLAAFLLWQTVTANQPVAARIDGLRYERALHVAGKTRQACAVLDGPMFPHAAPSLADMRIFSIAQGGMAREIPYAVTESEAVSEGTQPARLLDLKSMGGKIVFDLEMPQRAYTDVRLEMDPAMKNFVATADVTGSNALRGGVETALGSFTLFDLTAQHLSRNTTLALAESNFHYLHLVMRVVNAPGFRGGTAARFAPGMMVGAEVPPSREAQIVYTTVAQSAAMATVGRESRATIELPLRVPVERVSFVLAPGFKGNFSRGVRVTALAEETGDGRAALPEIVTGTILRVDASEAGRKIHSEELDVPAILGANLQGAAKVEVAIENGEEQALPITAVRLEMRQREVCFEAAADAGKLAVFYGDPQLAVPAYDYERRFAPSEDSLVVGLGPERLNAAYRTQSATTRTFGTRHRGVLWITLGAVLFALGAVVLRWPRS